MDAASLRSRAPMTPPASAYDSITWVLCVPDPGNSRRIVPYLHEGRGTVWFSELPFADRFLRENRALPRGARSKAVVGLGRLLAFATDLLKAGVRTVFLDLEYGRGGAGESLVSLAARLEGSRSGAR
jgi:hypothetical protein